MGTMTSWCHHQRPTVKGPFGNSLIWVSMWSEGSVSVTQQGERGSQVLLGEDLLGPNGGKEKAGTREGRGRQWRQRSGRLGMQVKGWMGGGERREVGSPWPGWGPNTPHTPSDAPSSSLATAFPVQSGDRIRSH